MQQNKSNGSAQNGLVFIHIHIQICANDNAIWISNYFRIIWVEKLNYEHLKPYLNNGFTVISKLHMQFTSFLKVFKIIEIWKSELDLTNIAGTSYHWCFLIAGVNDAIIHQLPNESTELSNILFKNLRMVSNTQLQ